MIIDTHDIKEYFLKLPPSKIETVEQKENEIPKDPSVKENAEILKSKKEKLKERKELQEINRKYNENLRFARENDVIEFSNEMLKKFENQNTLADTIINKANSDKRDDFKGVQPVLECNIDDINNALEKLLYHYVDVN